MKKALKLQGKRIMAKKTYTNDHDKKFLQLTFKDKDILHLRPGESITVDESKFRVVRKLYV